MAKVRAEVARDLGGIVKADEMIYHRSDPIS